MPNHVHLILVPATADGLARAIGETHRQYTGEACPRLDRGPTESGNIELSPQRQPRCVT